MLLQAYTIIITFYYVFGMDYLKVTQSINTDENCEFFMFDVKEIIDFCVKYKKLKQIMMLKKL